MKKLEMVRKIKSEVSFVMSCKGQMQKYEKILVPNNWNIEITGKDLLNLIDTLVDNFKNKSEEAIMRSWKQEQLTKMIEIITGLEMNIKKLLQEIDRINQVKTTRVNKTEGQLVAEINQTKEKLNAMDISNDKNSFITQLNRIDSLIEQYQNNYDACTIAITYENDLMNKYQVSNKNELKQVASSNESDLLENIWLDATLESIEINSLLCSPLKHDYYILDDGKQVFYNNNTYDIFKISQVRDSYSNYYRVYEFTNDKGIDNYLVFDIETNEYQMCVQYSKNVQNLNDVVTILDSYC